MEMSTHTLLYNKCCCCSLHHPFFPFMGLPSLSFFTPPQLLLIRPASQILILAWVKTLLPFRCGDSLFSLVAYRRTAVMEVFFFFFLQPIISLTYRNEGNMELYALRCNYPDSLTLSIPLSHSLPLSICHFLIRSQIQCGLFNVDAFKA